MSTAGLKKNIYARLENADDSVLKLVDALLKAYEKDEEIVGHSIDGQPITKSALQKRMKEAEQRLKKGDYVSHEDLKKEFGL